jgi:pimeloyl-ACP methyl ester carboxylesterase
MTSRGPVEYRLEGAGPAVVVLNGGHCTRRVRLSHERLAEAGFSVLTPSRPGYDSTPVCVGQSAQKAADALAELIEALGFSHCHVIGVSAAGPTAIAIAQRHPSLVRGLVLESAVTLPWDEPTKRGARLLFGSMRYLTWASVHAVLRVAPHTHF